MPEAILPVAYYSICRTYLHNNFSTYSIYLELYYKTGCFIVNEISVGCRESPQINFLARI